MQAVLLCFSQFTDTRQDRPRRARGRLQGTAGARRVRIARLLSSAARGSAQRRGPVTRVPVLSAGDARVCLGLRLASGVLFIKEAAKTSEVMPQRLRVQFMEVPTGQCELSIRTIIAVD